MLAVIVKVNLLLVYGLLGIANVTNNTEYKRKCKLLGQAFIVWGIYGGCGVCGVCGVGVNFFLLFSLA